MTKTEMIERIAKETQPRNIDNFKKRAKSKTKEFLIGCIEYLEQPGQTTEQDKRFIISMFR